MAEPFIGEIRMFGFNFPPRDWAKCDGQLIAISQNPALFPLLGTAYGGDGRTTFGLPDFRGRVPMHYGYGPGLSPRNIGARAGVEDVTLNQLNLPSANPIVATSAADTIISGGVIVKVSDSPGNAAAAPNKPLAKLAQDAQTSSAMEIYDNAATYTQGNTLGGVEHNITAATTVTTTITGGLQGGIADPVEIMQPYQVVNFCIALQGLFPSRN